jgi:haloalkane dehalogenase
MSTRSQTIPSLAAPAHAATIASDHNGVPAWLDREAYPFAHHWIDLAHGRMHYVDEGAGAPVLLIHGTPTWSFEYRHVINALAPHARVIAPDHLGFGLSARPRDFAYTPEAHSENLLELIDRLDLRNVTLVVHDFGGPIGLRLALDRPDRIARIVIINSWLWPFDDDAVMAKRARVAGGWVGKFLYKYFNASLRLIMPSAYGNRVALTTRIHQQYLEVFRNRDARVRVLHRLAVSLLGSSPYFSRLHDRMEELRRRPVLIVWGLKDSAFQPYQLERWRRELPEATVVTVDQAGHWPHEEAPDAVIAAIGQFAGIR